jgi:metal-sulfur cluster biosynthetic enzyme
MISLKDKVEDALRKVYDPEISINVLDLGLIYNIHIDKSHCHIQHTLTSFGCPFADQICMDIEQAVQNVDGIESVERELVWDPPFSMDMVPEETRFMMGW